MPKSIWARDKNSVFGEYIYISNINLLLNCYIRLIKLLVKAWADKLKVCDGDTKDASADRVVVGWDLIKKLI